MTSLAPPLDFGDWEKAADALRAWALDEELKAKVMGSPALSAAARRVARRYSAGEDVASAVAVVKASLDRGHLGSIEYAGESVRTAELARAGGAEVILELTRRIATSSVSSTVSGRLDSRHQF